MKSPLHQSGGRAHPGKSARPSATRRARAYGWIIGVVAAGALAAALAVNSAAQSPAGSAAPAAAAAPSGTIRLTDEQLRSMQVAPVVSLRFHSQIIADGQIAYDGDTLTPVYSPYSGRVTRVVAPLGAYVRKGAPLFTLDAAEFAQAQGDLATAAAQLRLNTLIEQRKQAQYQTRGVSLQEWQQAQSDLAASRAALAAVRNRLHSFGQSDAQIDAIMAAGNPARAQVAAVAPISGWVVDRQIGPGQYLQAGASTPVYTVADLSSVWLVAEVPEVDAGLVRVGQRVSARVTGLPGRVFSARLSYVAAAVDSTTRRVAVHAVLANRDGALKPQMFATLTIVTSADSLVPAVPEQAVIYEGAETRVWILTGPHDAALRRIGVGRTLGGMIEVLGGLQVGQQVFTRGALFIDRAASGD